MTSYRVLRRDHDVPDTFFQIGQAIANSAEAALRVTLADGVEAASGYSSLYVVVPDHNWSEFAPEISTQMRLVSLGPIPPVNDEHPDNDTSDECEEAAA